MYFLLNLLFTTSLRNPFRWIPFPRIALRNARRG
jgi:hypothetical protein